MVRWVVVGLVMIVMGCEPDKGRWWEEQETAAFDTQATLEAATIKQKRINEAFGARVNESLQKKEK